jgi:hypothetical protein
MEIMSFFGKARNEIQPLPRGSFTVDREGRVLASTLPQTFPADVVNKIASDVQGAFEKAHTAQISVNELVIRYTNLKITARELRGGAIIYLTPQTLAGN